MRSLTWEVSECGKIDCCRAVFGRDTWGWCTKLAIAVDKGCCGSGGSLSDISPLDVDKREGWCGTPPIDWGHLDGIVATPDFSTRVPCDTWPCGSNGSWYCGWTRTCWRGNVTWCRIPRFCDVTAMWLSGGRGNFPPSVCENVSPTLDEIWGFEIDDWPLFAICICSQDQLQAFDVSISSTNCHYVLDFR